MTRTQKHTETNYVCYLHLKEFSRAFKVPFSLLLTNRDYPRAWSVVSYSQADTSPGFSRTILDYTSCFNIFIQSAPSIFKSILVWMKIYIITLINKNYHNFLFKTSCFSPNSLIFSTILLDPFLVLVTTLNSNF